MKLNFHKLIFHTKYKIYIFSLQQLPALCTNKFFMLTRAA